MINDISLFENTKCIITIAITDLAEGLKNLRKHKSGGFLWIPADSGEKILFQRSGNKISFQHKTKKIEIEFDLFYKSVYDLGNKLVTELLHFRNEVVNESAYIYLINILKD